MKGTSLIKIIFENPLTQLQIGVYMITALSEDMQSTYNSARNTA